MKQRALFLTLLFSVTVNVVLLATMSARVLVASRDEARKARPLCEGLTLSPRQAQAIDSTRRCFAVEAGGVCLALYREKQSLVELLGANPPDSVTIASCLHRIDSLQSVLQRRAVRAILREREVMTPEQAAAYLAMIRQRLAEEAPCRHLECADSDTCLDNDLQGTNCLNQRR
ncbi:MAG: periplasmic heavy metal sensor [candidate division KSB1 bacterium]|nr:periplasmic heavy metal sensor [candidate division KSB1 bacterium]MDZ7293895.1 periplasmic heavy metal sensor [candidate division KSB1 bacterium]MDZ7378095.1 periplasmic heavy metal sensor [candidate division KSB1 bacterium]MDZ7384705.1 periplasmic heavy metal sensor [candidate division KSB1 bacterium]MDZ7392274.1 periplasmic heavy metal sensor [candidate division KSB1 bacterium]